jgi:hypothetical protein
VKTINFRVSDDEHALMHFIAEHEGLTLTAYIRRHFILQARVLGIAPNPQLTPAHSPTPASAPPRPLASGLPPRPKEFVNARWYAHSAYETERLYDRLTAEGHTEQDVADWYQQPVEALRARVDSVRNPALTEEEKIASQCALLTMRANALGLPPPGQAAPHVLDPAVAAKLDDLFP